jgi:hypothetical protein
MLNEQLKTKIEQDAKDYANLEICDWGKIQGNRQLHDWELAHEVYKDAAEAYVEKWQEAEASAKARGEIITQLNNRLTNLETEKNEAKKLLDEVFRKHESGLLPDRFVYEKIKSFLYPTPKTTTDV